VGRILLAALTAAALLVAADVLDLGPLDEAGETGRGRVVRVIDGDTVQLRGVGRVRLIGVDTPERGACLEDAATRFTQERIGGRRVRYELGEETRDRYGRTLAYLSTKQGMHNLALVRRGLAETLTIPPNDRFAGRFRRAERRARREGLGRWSRC
jgi:micrococcal nuclease